jgi:hypothetical protein
LGFQVSATEPEHEIRLTAMHDGDNYSLLSKQQTAAVMVSGQQIGTITSPQFAEVMLATFLGPKPTSPRLKQELLSRGRYLSESRD